MSSAARASAAHPCGGHRADWLRLRRHLPRLMRTAALLLLPLCVLLQSGCAERKSAVEAANEQGILLRGNGAEPQTLDPQFATGIPEANIITALYEGLITPDPQTLEPRPGVAERWEVSEDGLRYTFHLRPDARWSNGEPVRAQDFLFAYERMLQPQLGAQNASFLYVLQNAQAYHEGKISDFAEVGASAPDERTLVLTLSEPTPYFLGLLQHIAWLPLYPPLMEQFNAVRTRESGWNRPGVLVSNGPFTLADWNVAESLGVRKNPHYWDADAVSLNGVRFYPIANLNTEERAFRAGQLHMTNGLPVSKVRRYVDSQAPELFNHAFLGTYYYVFNCERKPFDDPRVRLALSLVIDRDAIARHVLGAGQLPATALVPPGTANHSAGATVDGSVEQARQLLAEAGYPEGRGFPQVSLLYNTSENHKLVAEAVQRMWQDTLGIRVGLINQDWKVYLQSRHSGDYDIARGGWIGDYNDPKAFLSIFAGNSGLNWTRWSEPAYDALLAAAATEPDLTERAALLQKAEQQLLDSAPLIPLYYYVSNYLLHPSVQGWHPNVLDMHPYSAVSLAKGDAPQSEPAHASTAGTTQIAQEGAH